MDVLDLKSDLDVRLWRNEIKPDDDILVKLDDNYYAIKEVKVVKANSEETRDTYVISLEGR